MIPLRCCLLLLVLLAGAAAEATGPTPFPDAKDEAAWPGTGPIRVFGWMVDNRAWFWTQRAKARGSVVFVGDSLTGNWKTLSTHFPDLQIANRGIGGDVSRGVLFRFQEDVLDLEPRAVVLCIGTNDLSAHGAPAGIMANIAAIIDQARARRPDLPIVLCTIPPRDAQASPTRPGAQQDLNARLAAYAVGKPHLVLLDLFAELAGPDGLPVATDFAADRIHLAEPGYAKWAAALKPVLARLLARPAAAP